MISFLSNEDSRVLYLRSLHERLLYTPFASDVNDKFSLLTQAINETTVSFTVEKQFVQKENNIPWYSKKIENQILLRDKYLKQYLANPTSVNKLRYTASRNYTNRLIKSEKYKPRLFYRELNKLSGRNVTKAFNIVSKLRQKILVNRTLQNCSTTYAAKKIGVGREVFN